MHLDLEKGLGILTAYHPHTPKMPLSLNDSSKAPLPKILFYCFALAPYDPKSLPKLLHMTSVAPQTQKGPKHEKNIPKIPIKFSFLTIQSK